MDLKRDNALPVVAQHVSQPTVEDVPVMDNTYGEFLSSKSALVRDAHSSTIEASHSTHITPAD